MCDVLADWRSPLLNHPRPLIVNLRLNDCHRDGRICAVAHSLINDNYLANVTAIVVLLRGRSHIVYTKAHGFALVTTTRPAA